MKVFLANVIVVATLLIIAEGVSRVIKPVSVPDPMITRNQPDWVGTRIDDPLLFWKMRPLISMGGKIITNSLGLRGREIPPKSPKEFRILSLGESTTFARRLPYEKNYSSLLEGKLGTVDGKGVRVINAGVPGYTLFQGVTYLRLRGLPLHPDAVLIYFGYNDFIRVSRRLPRDAYSDMESFGSTDRELFEQRKKFRYRFTYWLLEHSNLVRIFSQHNAITRNEVESGSKFRVPEPDRRRLLTELISLCKSNNVRLVIIIPWYLHFDLHIPVLRELKNSDDVVLVDLPDKLAKLKRPKESFFVDPIHPYAEGHHLIADAIAEELRAAWKISPSEHED